MEGRLPKLFLQALHLWQSLSRRQQITALTGAVVVIALSFGLAMWSQQPNYSVLFSNLQSQDASNIVTKLKSDKEPYQLTDGGTTIMVPDKDVDSLRLEMASAGLPANGVVGFEIFDQSNIFGMDSFTEHLNYQRALQGELTRTIEQVNGVSSAFVNLVIPQSDLYQSQQQQTTASVVLKLDPGSQLAPNQVNAIQHLVASSVQGLKPEDVTVVDTNGNNLTTSSSADGITAYGQNAAAPGTQMSVQQQYEQSLENKVSTMLDQMLGPNKSITRVNATLNWNQVQSSTTMYGGTALPTAIASQQNSSETLQGATNTAGVAGTGTNLLPTGTPGAGTPGTTYQKSSSSTTYVVSTSQTQTTQAPGALQRLSVSVILNGNFSQSQISSIQQAVDSTVGADTTRGDVVTVESMPFDTSAAKANQAAQQAAQQQSMFINYGEIGGSILALIIILFFALRFMRKSTVNLAAPQVSLVPLDQEPEPSAGSDVDSLNAGLSNAMLAAESREKAREIAAKQHQHEMAKTQLVEIAHENPKALADLVERWLEER